MKMILILAVGACVTLSGCNEDKVNAADSSQAIKNCAANDTIPGAAIRYTGPTGVGPGTEWAVLRRTTEDGKTLVVTQIGATPETIFGNPPPKDIFAPEPTAAGCSMSSTSKTNLGLTFGLSGATLPVSGALKTDLAKAKILSVSVEGFAWHSLQLLNFNDRLLKLPAGSPFKGGGPIPIEVALSMLKVKNYVATLDVTDVKGVDLKAKYNGPLPKELTGDLSAGVTASYDGKGHLELKVPGETYVAGVFWPLNAATSMVQSGAKPPSSLPPFKWEVEVGAFDEGAPRR